MRPESSVKRRAGGRAGVLTSAAAVLGGLLLGGYTLALCFAGTTVPDSEQRQAITRIERSLREKAPSSERARSARWKHPAGAIAVMRIPALGKDWVYPVHDGIGEKALSKGLGHYPRTGQPGAVGNFAVAGHRSSLTGYQPFADLPDRIATGDVITVSSPDGVFTYIVTGTRHTKPTDVGVLAPDQSQFGQPAGSRLITLTTCTPRYGRTGRFIVFGRLVEPVRPSGDTCFGNCQPV